MDSQAPRVIDNARVLFFSTIDERHHHTRNTRQIVAGVLQGPAKGMAICQYEGEDSFYLFGCDENWKSVTDTWHPTIDDAKAQAEFEYEGISKTWETFD